MAIRNIKIRSIRIIINIIDAFALVLFFGLLYLFFSCNISSVIASSSTIVTTKIPHIHRLRRRPLASTLRHRSLIHTATDTTATHSQVLVLGLLPNELPRLVPFIIVIIRLSHIGCLRQILLEGHLI